MERFPFTPDYGAQQQAQPRILKAQFGDGYAQRAEDGLRATLQRWALQFNTRRKAEADAIDAFLLAHRGTLPFEFVAPTSAWAVTGFRFGTGDGARTQFLLERPLAPGAAELVPATGRGAPPVLYLDGAPLVAGADYVLSSSGLVTFAVPPTAGAALTFTGAGERVLRVVCESWSTTVKGFNAHDVSAEFHEVAG
ncbi:phage tail protein [Myxococcus sp. K38C18041901]|uniref:phage tail protein n=1 Tax=Myxococcus guangdongensis TaxID=2906760 RepID=UPI0020A7E563|nr:phage tail protein [Myxococcus guangdongensis]MCP3065792.1 phage tail protein [Myxococcus guangdongensis]